jgi:hypothetical protein
MGLDDWGFRRAGRRCSIDRLLQQIRLFADDAGP